MSTANKNKVSRRQLLKAAGGALVSVFVLRISAAESGGATREYAYVIDTTKCIGCGSCVRACQEENDVPDGSYRRWIERYTVTTSGEILVESPDGGADSFDPPAVNGDEVAKSFFVPKMCNHCSSPPCVQVCPVGATFRTSDGAVLVDSKRCMGCGYCVQSCAYSARFMNPKTHTADKCTWCYHRISRGRAPACVAVCPVGALQFGDSSEGGELRDFILRQRVDVLKGELGTEPAVYYRGLSMEVR